jgi:hypothetical protein
VITFIIIRVIYALLLVDLLFFNSWEESILCDFFRTGPSRLCANSHAGKD